MEYNATNTNASTMRGVRVRVRRDEYDVHENGGQDPVGEYDGEQDAVTMLDSFVTMLAQLSVSETVGSGAIRADECDGQ
jgi:hypothetical protein